MRYDTKEEWTQKLSDSLIEHT